MNRLPVNSILNKFPDLYPFTVTSTSLIISSYPRNVLDKRNAEICIVKVKCEVEFDLKARLCVSSVLPL